ncbi:M24 family metallopeptidase [Virgibacillus byunsanensis]|uniref:M24 family metallopeptidase n=1 Tax=Virgibacillus byunsanensis TaxID=570945 RepID=A0ABW3LGF1_9BACI
MKLSISKEETYERQQRFLSTLTDKQLECAILFNSTDIFYLTRFYFIPTERPMSFFIDPTGKTHLFVPALEVEHATEFSCVDQVHSYPEYPGENHPMIHLKAILKELGFEHNQIGIDSEGYGSPYGYSGASVRQLIDAEYTSIHGLVQEIRYIKSAAEIEIIKESCRWGNLAHRLLQKYSIQGSSEVEIELRASQEASLAMIETLGQEYKPHGRTARAGFRGQIGEMSAFPHAVTQNNILKNRDTLVTYAAADVWDYHSELERTMFVNEVTSEQEKYFHLMYGAQETAFQHIKPGQPTSTVEREVQKYYKENGIQHLTRHHTGHALGLLIHEAPFFDLGDHTIMKAGMVFSVEPGIYVEGLGGFRHSDTILVTENGMEMLTYYPRDLNSMIC